MVVEAEVAAEADKLHQEAAKQLQGADKAVQGVAKVVPEAAAARVVPEAVAAAKVVAGWEPLVAKVADNKVQNPNPRAILISPKLSKRVLEAGQVAQVVQVVEVAQILEAEQVDQAVEVVQDSKKPPTLH